MKKSPSSQQSKVELALKKLVEAAQELSNVLDETEYTFSNAAPTYLQDADDFAYDLTTFAEDELEVLRGVSTT